MYKIYPKVKKMNFLSNKEYVLPNKFIIFFNHKMVNVFKKLSASLKCEEGNRKEADILFLVDFSLNEEAYRLEISEDKITVFYHYENGAFYAAVSLLQLIRGAQGRIRTLVIEDEPDLKIRGFMMDVSRDKVPQIATVKKIIDFMSDLKMNHLELYVEGFSYGYPSFKHYLAEDGFISVEEYRELENYARENFIDLVPNQNGFGHMAKWLEKEEFKDLAELPEGLFLWGRHRKPGTLNPLDERSLDLIKTMYHDMLPNSSSRYFNMNFDEPFELGKGKSKEACEQYGVGNVYIDYVLKAYCEIKKYDKTPLIWGDVLIKHPELLQRLPQDMIFIDWGYDAGYPFSQNLKKLKELGIKFMAAPGTTSWCSFTGRTFDWWENITNACVYTKIYDGEGVLLTDWGDFGHLQFLPTSYPALIYAGLMSWRVAEGTYFTVRDYLNRFVYNDNKNIIADAVLDLGNYYRYLNEYRSNGTATFHNFMWATYAVGEVDSCRYYQQRTASIILDYDKYLMLERFLTLKEEEIALAEMDTEDGDIVRDELIQSIAFLKIIHKLNIAYNDKIALATRIKLLKEVITAREDFITKQKRLWLYRNKSGGLASSLSYIDKFYCFVEMTLNYIRGGDNEAQI
ncbi:MAG: family 20 glycosylhydrolase [Bacilli bacterium]|nr:family 20 glycosylhydrolase [Bacilli bacterium]